MLQHLVCVDDIERVVRKSSLCTSEVVNEMFDRRCSWASARARLKASSVGSTPVTDPGTTRAARSTVIVRAATDVEHRQPRHQVGQQVAGGVFRSASPVTAQHRLVISVRINRPTFVVHRAVPWSRCSAQSLPPLRPNSGHLFHYMRRQSTGTSRIGRSTPAPGPGPGPSKCHHSPEYTVNPRPAWRLAGGHGWPGPQH